MLITGKASWERTEEIAAGQYPRKDYFELARALNADIIDHRHLPGGWWGHLLRRALGVDVLLAWEGFRRRTRYQLLYSDSEAIGIPLACLLKLVKDRRAHIMIAHVLTPFKKQVFFRWFNVHSHISAIICHASRQQRRAVEDLGIPREKVALLPYQVDEQWWRAPVPAAPAAGTPTDTPTDTAAAARPVICTAGLERRDYPTLLEAIRGVPAQLVIAAASFWAKQQAQIRVEDVPDNVEIVALDYVRLRELYARSAFVVMPLQDVDFQAGITTILEAMSMGKAVIVSHTIGQVDVVIDRRNVTRGSSPRVLPSGFGRLFGQTEGFGPTGLYVPPGDPVALQRAIRFLLDHPETTRTLGENGRRLAAEVMSLDAFVERIAALADTCVLDTPDAEPRSVRTSVKV
jgi:glycosyltransferase involved in cell wall biosynthesis